MQPASEKMIFLVLALGTAAGGCALRTDPMLLPDLRAEAHPQQQSVALVKYGGGILVVIAAEGTAVVDFQKPFYNDGIGVNYRYRFLRRHGGDEVIGTGMAREKWEPVSAEVEPWPAGRRSAMIRSREMRDAGTVPYVEAGDIRFEWSAHDAGSGWIYFEPNQYRIKVARRAEFEVLDLRRGARAG
jgi:hypothetical protein